MIYGLSERRQLPRLGKIRLGVLVSQPGKRPYPRATDFFVCPPEVARLANDNQEQPRSLPVMLPSDSPELNFPQQYKMYRTSGLWCQGDGRTARRWDDQGKLKELSCPCDFLESGECGPHATLNLLVPDAPGFGVYQIDTGNVRSIVSLNSSMDYFTRVCGGLTGIPFDLLLEPQSAQRWDEKSKAMVKTTIYVMRLDTKYTLRQLVEARGRAGKPVELLLPASVDEADDREPATPKSIEAPSDEIVEAPREVPTVPVGDMTVQPLPMHMAVEPAGERPAIQISMGSETLKGYEEPWDLRACYRAVAKLGLAPDEYERYFRKKFSRSTSDFQAADLEDQRKVLGLALKDGDYAARLLTYVRGLPR